MSNFPEIINNYSTWIIDYIICCNIFFYKCWLFRYILTFLREEDFVNMSQVQIFLTSVKLKTTS